MDKEMRRCDDDVADVIQILISQNRLISWHYSSEADDKNEKYRFIEFQTSILAPSTARDASALY